MKRPAKPAMRARIQEAVVVALLVLVLIVILSSIF